MSSVLIAVAPKSLPEGLPGALVLLLLGMTVVFVVLGGLTLLIWFIGRVARERPVEAAATAAEVERGEPAATAAGGGGTTEAKAAARDEPAGEPFTSAESAAVTVAVVLEASGRTVPAGGPFTSEELAGVAVAAALEASGRTVPAGGPFTSEELAGVAVAAALEASGRTVPAGGPFTSAEMAAVGAAVEAAVRGGAGGMPAGAVVEVVRTVAESPGAAAWGAAAFAGRGGAGMPVLRRG